MDTMITADGTVIVPSIDFGRHCVSCGASAHPGDAPHLCKKYVEAYLQEIDEHFREYGKELLVHGGEG